MNQLLAAAQQSPIPPNAQMKRGLFFALLGKQSFFTSFGSRYVVVKDTYDLYTGLLYAQTVKASENAFGPDQESYVVQRLEQSAATHKVLVSSYSLISMQLDLTHIPGVPAQFARNFYFDVDQWDGFPNKRSELYARLSGVTNLIALSGDIHGAFAGNEKAATPTVQPKFALLTSPAISSQSLSEELGVAVQAFSPDPAFQPGGAIYEALVNNLPALLTNSTGGAIKYVNTSSHGFLDISFDATKATATFNVIPASEVATDYSTRTDLGTKFTTKVFDVAGGVLTEV